MTRRGEVSAKLIIKCLLAVLAGMGATYLLIKWTFSNI